MNSKKKFSFRKLVSVINALSFFFMVISGIVLFFAPQGRIAYWIEWKFFYFTKDDWINIHTASWFLFLIASLFHIYFNFKPLKNYVISKLKSITFISKETILAFIILFIFLFTGIIRLPPANWLISLNEKIKDWYVKKPDYDPPFGHAEEVSLKTIAKRMGLNLKLAIEELKNRGIVFENENEKIKDIAMKNKKKPKDIYSIISKFKIEESKKESLYFTAEDVEEKFSGTGIGRKTLKFFCDENKIDLNLAKENLKRGGIQMEENDTFKDIASKYDTTPIEILKVILVNNYKLKGGSYEE